MSTIVVYAIGKRADKCIDEGGVAAERVVSCTWCQDRLVRHAVLGFHPDEVVWFCSDACACKYDGCVCARSPAFSIGLMAVVVAIGLVGYWVRQGWESTSPGL